MALHLNLLHEEILEQRQRQRDPLKIGMIALVICGALLFLYYTWSAYRTLEIRSRLTTIERAWKKIEPKVTAAEKRIADLESVLKTTRALDDYIDNRFFWAPFLQKISRCVAPNTQLTNFEGNLLEEPRAINVSLEGIAAGREPRSVAEDLRQTLLEQFSLSYSDVKAEFKTLEDLDTILNVGGTHMATAHYILTVNFNPTGVLKPAESPAATRARKR
jgi:hypothetical protein